MTHRSYLFVPADRPERYAKALAAGAGAVIVDLEDAVAPAAKDAARSALASWLSSAPSPVIVRVNAADTAWFADDLALCGHASVAGVMVPKAERRADLAHASALAAGKRLYPLIETAAGFDAMRTLAGAPGVERLVFGSIDFQVDLGIDGEGDELLYFRSQMVLVSRLAGVRAPVDGVSTAIDDAAALRADAERARRLGFGAKLCIHPRQVDVVNRAFMPSDDERDWARRVLDAAARAGGAAVAVDGKMVDKPVMLRAQTILDGADDASPPGATSRPETDDRLAKLQAFWNARYAGTEDYVYGTEPNDFVVQSRPAIPRSGNVLCIADGEGRNSVWLARQGYGVTAIDVAAEGIAKARRLAEGAGVSLETAVADVTTFDFGAGRWDAIVSIYLHLPAKARRDVHRRALAGLKPGGVFVYEAYGPEQVRYKSGGPPEPELLHSLDDVVADLEGCAIEHAFAGVRAVNEGRQHRGDGYVVQVIARKRG